MAAIDMSLVPENAAELWEAADVPRRSPSLTTDWFPIETGKAELLLATACEVRIVTGPDDRIGVAIWGSDRSELKVNSFHNCVEVRDIAVFSPDETKAQARSPSSRFLDVAIVAPYGTALNALLAGGGRMFSSAEHTSAELTIRDSAYANLNAREMTATVSNQGSLSATVVAESWM